MPANGEVINLSLNMTANVAQAKKELQDLQATLNNLTQKATMKNSIGGTLTKDISQATSAAIQLKTQLQNATNIKTGQLDLGVLSTSLKQSGTTLEQYRVQFNKLGPEGTAAFNQVATAITQAAAPMKQSNALIEGMWTNLKKVASWQISSSVLHGFMGSISGAYKYAQDLNESLNNIRIVTGQSTAEMAKFAEQANKSAKALSSTTTEYTDAALIFYQQGLTGKEVTDRTDVAIKLANVTGQSAQEISNQMTAIWNNFDDGSKSLEYYADVITNLGAHTASSSKEIAEGLEKFAAIGDTVGLSYEYATTALSTVVAQTRQSADIVGTAFKTIFSRLQGLSLGETLEDGTNLNKYSDALQKVNVDIKESDGSLKEMDEILDDLGGKWQALGQDQKMALAQTVAGTRQYTQLIALMDNWGTFQENLTYANNAEGTLQEQQDIYADSWEAASKRVQAAAEDMYSALLDDKFFIGITNFTGGLIEGFTKVIKAAGGLPTLLMTIILLINRLFGPQISSQIDNMVLSLRRYSKSYQEQAEAQRQQGFDVLKANINQQYGMDSIGGQAINTALMQRLKLQQQFIELNDQLSEKQKFQLQTMFDLQNEQIEELKNKEKEVKLTQQQLELEEKRLKSDSIFKSQEAGLDAQRVSDKISDQAKVVSQKTATATVMAGLDDSINKSDMNNAEKIKLIKEEIDKLKHSVNETGQVFEETFGQKNNIDKLNDRIEQTEEQIKQLNDLKNQIANNEISAEEVQNQIGNMQFDFKDTQDLQGNISGDIESINQLIDNLEAHVVDSVHRMASGASAQADNAKIKLEEYVQDISSKFDSATGQAINSVKKIFDQVKNVNQEDKKNVAVQGLEKIQKSLGSKAPREFREAIKIALDDLTIGGKDANKVLTQLMSSLQKAGNEIKSKFLEDSKVIKNLAEQMGYTEGEVTNLLRSILGLGNATEKAFESDTPITFGQKLTAVTSAISSVGMALSSLNGLINTWNNQDISMGEKLITTMTTLGMVVGSVSAAFTGQSGAILANMGLQLQLIILKHKGASAEVLETVAKEGSTKGTIAQTGANYGLLASMPPLLLTAIAMAAAFAALALVFWAVSSAQEAEKKKAEQQRLALEGAKDATEDLATKANEAREAYKKLLEQKDTHNNLKDELDSLTQGTDAYNTKLQEMLALIQQVQETEPGAKISYTEQGTPYIDNKTWDKMLEKERKSAVKTMLSQATTTFTSILNNYRDKIIDQKGTDIKFKGVDNKIYTFNGNNDYDNANQLTHYQLRENENITFDTESKNAYKDTILIALNPKDKKIIADNKKRNNYVTITSANGNVYQIDESTLSTLSAVELNSEDKTTGNGIVGPVWSTRDVTSISMGHSGFTGNNVTLTNDTIANAIDSIITDYPKIKGEVANVYANAVTSALLIHGQDETVDPTYAQAFGQFYSYLKTENANPVELLKQVETYKKNITNNYQELIKDTSIDEQELLKSYKEKENITEDITTSDDNFKSWAISYMQQIQAAGQVFEELNGNKSIVDEYKQNISNKSFKELLTISSMGNGTEVTGTKLDQNITDNLVKALVDDRVKSFDDYLTFLKNNDKQAYNEMNQILSDFKINETDNLNTMWVQAQKETQQSLKFLYDSFGINNNNKAQRKLVDNLGGQNLFKIGNVLKRWDEEADKVNAAFSTKDLFKNFLDTDMFKNAENTERLYEKISNLSFQNPVQAAAQIKKLTQDTNENISNWGKKLQIASSELTSTAQQVKYIYNNMDEKAIAELFKSGATTREEIIKLTESIPDLKTMLDTTGVSASTLSVYFNKVHDSILDINNTSNNFINALDEINKASNIITDSIDYTTNFKASTSAQAITDNLTKWRESVKQSLERGQYGDQTLIDYTKAVLGIDKFEEYKEKFNGNLSQVEQIALEKLNSFGDTFYNTWNSLASKSDMVSIGSGGMIEFNLEQIDSIENLRQELMDKMGFSKEIADAAIADAETYSSTLQEQFKRMQIGASVKTLLEGSNRTVLDVLEVSEDEIKVLADEAKINTSELQAQIQASINNNKEYSGITLSIKPTVEIDTSKKGVITEDSKAKLASLISDEMSKTTFDLKNNKIDQADDIEIGGFSLDKLYTKLKNAGVDEDKIKGQIVNIAKMASKEFKGVQEDVMYYYKDGSLQIVKGINEQNKAAFAQAIGISESELFNSVKKAVSTGYATGFKDPKVRAQEMQAAMDQTKTLAEAVALGYALGDQIIRDGDNFGAGIALQLKNRIKNAISEAFSEEQKQIDSALGKVDNGIDFSSVAADVQEAFGGIGTGYSYSDLDSQIGGWDNTDKDSKSSGSKSKEEIKKMSDEEERYHVINKQIDATTSKLELLDKIKSQAYGKDKLKAMNDEIKAQKILLKQEKEKEKQARRYLKQDAGYMLGYGAQFDKDGNIKNYKQVLQQQVNKYNNAVKNYNASAQTDADKAALDNAKTNYETFKKYLEKYEDSLATAQDQANKIATEKAKLLELKLGKIDYKLQIKVDIDEHKLAKLQKRMSRLQDANFTQAKQISNITKQANNLIDQSSDTRKAMKETIQAGTDKQLTKKQIDAIMNGTMSKKQMVKLGFGEETVNQLTNYRDKLEDINDRLVSLQDQIPNTINTFMDQYLEKMKSYTAEIEYQQKLMKNIQTIADLLGPQANLSQKDKLSGQQAIVDNAQANVRANKAIRDTAQKEYEEFEKAYNKAAKKGFQDEATKQKWKDDLQARLEAWQNAELEMQNATIAGLQAIQEAWKTEAALIIEDAKKAADEATKTFNNSKEIRDRYYAEYKRMYETSKLVRQINQSMEKTDNLKSQKLYNNLLKEVAQYQKSGAEMSKYDIEYLQKKYALTEAQIALEESRNAKSQVRLSRDSEGNYGYVYTADDSNIDKAQQNYEDKLYELQNFMATSIDDLANQYVQSMQKMYQEIETINNDMTLSDEERKNKLDEIYAHYSKMQQFYVQETQDLTNRGKDINKEFVDYNGNLSNLMAEDIHDTIFNKVYPDVGDFQTLLDTHKDQTKDDIEQLKTAFKTYGSRINTVCANAGYDIKDFKTTYSNMAKDVSQDSKKAADSTEDMQKKQSKEYDKIKAQLDNWYKNVEKNVKKVIDKNKEAADSIDKIKTAYINATSEANKATASFNEAAKAAYKAKIAIDNMNISAKNGEDIETGPGVVPKTKISSPTTTPDSEYVKIGALVHGYERTYYVKKDYWSANANKKIDKKASKDESGILNENYLKLDFDAYNDIEKILWYEKNNKKIKFDTGGYTGEWGASGKMAMLHEKELVLNKSDTQNMLTIIDMVRLLVKDLNKLTIFNRNLHSLSTQDLSKQSIEQKVEIKAEFPNVEKHEEIEQAFENLVNKAAQYANLK